MKRRLTVAMQMAIPVVCVVMAIVSYAQSTDVKVAILSTRADQIDTHLTNTDTNVKALGDKIDKLSDELAEMHGEENSHHLQDWGVSGVLSAAAFLLGYRKKKETEEE